MCVYNWYCPFLLVKIGSVLCFVVKGVLLYDSDVGSENALGVRSLLRNFSIFPFGLTNGS